MRMLDFIRESIVGRLLLLIIIAWIILAIIFGFSDLEISKAVVDRESQLANFIYIYGELPGWGLMATAIAVFIGSNNDDIKKQKLPAYIIIVIGVVLLIIALIINFLWLIIFSVGITLGLLIFLIFAFNKDWREFKTIATVVILLIIINPLLFVQITKLLCGRIRFNDLASDYSNYTPWFQPPGYSGFRSYSFPSGHTSMGFLWLPFLIVLKDRKWRDPVRIIATILIIAWGFIDGISTIIYGAHYASDILFSAGVAAVSTILLYKKFYFDKK